MSLSDCQCGGFIDLGPDASNCCRRCGRHIFGDFMSEQTKPSNPDPWAHRSAGMKCETCLWFVLKKSTEQRDRDHQIGRCRRHAPTMNGYPVVYLTDWCGDHKLDENKA